MPFFALPLPLPSSKLSFLRLRSERSPSDGREVDCLWRLRMGGIDWTCERKAISWVCNASIGICTQRGVSGGRTRGEGRKGMGRTYVLVCVPSSGASCRAKDLIL